MELRDDRCSGEATANASQVVSCGVLFCTDQNWTDRPARITYVKLMRRYCFGDDTEAPGTFGQASADDDTTRHVATPVSEQLGRALAARPSITFFDADREIVAPGSGLIIEIELPATRH